MNKKIYVCMIMTMVILGISISGKAETVSKYEGTSIPDYMKPGSIIEYIDSSHFIIEQGGFETLLDKEKRLSNIDEEPDAEKIELEKAAKQDGSYYTALTEKYPAPRKGMKVIYGSDGELSNIEDSWHNDIPCVIRSKYTSSKKAIVEAAAKKTLIAKWGKNNRNKLYKKGGNIIGYGRATTFADKIGQKDHTLKKGDVATKLAYDNCKFGLSVDVKARKYKSKTKETHTMYKRDAGGMPDAIVDIWKTGVEKWGYKYSSSLSIPGETKITHENKK